MSDILVIGSGGHAGVLVSIVRRDGVGDLRGYLDCEDRGQRHGLACLGDDETDPGADSLLYGVGLVNNAVARWDLYRRHRNGNATFLVLVSGRASVAVEARLGAGTVVLDLAAVNTGAVLGEACIVNTGAVVEHDCRLGDNVHVAPGAVLCGEVTVGDHVLVGAGSVVVPGVSIAGGSIIGAGAVVAGDLTRPGTYVGSPAVRRGEGMAP